MLDFLGDIWNHFVDFMYQLLLTLIEMLKDVLIWILDELMEVGILLVDGMGELLTGLDVASYFSLIPSGTAYYLNALGVSQALGMIVTALSIRFLLQLIPLVRLGS